MPPSPIYNPIPSFISKISLYLRTYFWKFMFTTVFDVARYLKPSVFAKYAPTYTKRYPVRSMLESRVFIPKTYQSGQSLPLYIDIHGGAFFGCSPKVDDAYCRAICDKFNYVVVSIEYRLAPAYQFPIPVDDCIELTLAVLNDPDLPIDQDRVAIGGQSAGGNLALTVSQDVRIRSKLKAVVAFYPATDFSHVYTGEYRDKPADANGKGAEKDMLRPLVPTAQWAYVPYGQDLTDPRLSPIYAEPSSLPSRIYFIAAEYDKLCQEAFLMACKLAGKESTDEAEHWEQNGIRWERLSDEVHGFLEAHWRAELAGEKDVKWKREVENVIDRVGNWLDGIFRS